MTAVYVIISIICLLLLYTVLEVVFLVLKKPVQELPSENDTEYYSTDVNGKKFEELYLYLSEEKTETHFNEDEIYLMLFKQSEYMKARFDCADFRAQLLFKIYKDCGEKLSERCMLLIKDTFLSFKYFMDEPGDDSMCFWSENHQILFAVSEYLAGQQWRNEIFSNDGKTGKEHMIKAKERIDAWMKQRFDYGFSEYLSNNYLAEDISPMANYIAYCEDKKSAEQMKIIMDILWLDVALNSVNNRFVSVSSRMYGNNKAGNFYGNSIQSAMNILWGTDIANHMLENSHISDTERELIGASLNKKPNHIVLCFNDIVKKGIYVLPEVIKDIALSSESFCSKMSCGLSPDEMEQEGLIGQAPYQIMAQWGAETFTNPQVIENTIEYLRSNEMYRNSFLGYFKFLDITLLKRVNWKKVAKRYNLMPHGIATGRVNIYTYRTAHYSMSTSVCKDVDLCGAQEHIWSADLGENLTLFTTHPAGNGKGRYGSSPGYWIGNGRRPMSVQEKNVNITIYKIPTHKRIGETAVSHITHAYMPKAFYDEFELKDNIVFARKNGVFAALISNGRLQYKPFNDDSANGIHKGRKFSDELRLKDEFDLCRLDGKYHSYVTELSDADKETFDEFKARINKNKIIFTDNGTVEYETDLTKISVSYDGAWSVNGLPAEKEYLRYDSKFCKAERKPSVITVKNGNNSLILDFNNVKRHFSCH